MEAINEANRRREYQIRHNLLNEIIPKPAQRSGREQSQLLGNSEERRTDNLRKLYDMEATSNQVSDMPQQYAADTSTPYNGANELDQLIDKARQSMEEAARNLDFSAAARYRDRMYELQKMKGEL